MASGGRAVRARVWHAQKAGSVVRFAAREMAWGMSAMLGGTVGVEATSGLDARSLAAEAESAARSAADPASARAGSEPPPGRDAAPAPHSAWPSSGERASGALPDDSFTVARGPAPAAADAGPRAALLITGATERAALHGAYDVLGRLGARFALGRAPELPRTRTARLDTLAPYRFAPAFARRAFVSDIMTWHYGEPDRLRMHLEHDREFVPWMARHGINAFSYIRHTQDSRFKIEELAPILVERGIDAEYGGHVLQLLLPREQFALHPEYFPCADDGRRNQRGNLCVSNPAALKLVREGALRYVRDNPEIPLLHIWGADVRRGAWCRCTECAATSPQLQYMKVVNEIAGALAEEGNGTPAVAYLAYHDTREPDPALRPLGNVWFEWAPRERCYSHAIDDPLCTVNPRCLEALERFVELFDGRGGVFEYYADAILFCGMGFATPSVIVRDLRAYHRMGLRSISCLTFGAFSAVAYPVNLETFVRATRSLDVEPEAALGEIVAGSYPQCAAPMNKAYRAITRASALALAYGDVMRPRPDNAGAPCRRERILGAAAAMREAVAAAGVVLDGASSGAADSALRLEISARRNLWKYSAQALEGLAGWLEARTLTGAERSDAGARAIEKVDAAISHIRDIDSRFKGTWGEYDLERNREIWLAALRRRLDE